MSVSTDLQLLKREESRSGIEPRSFAYQPNALPLGQTGSQSYCRENPWIRVRVKVKDQPSQCLHGV